MTFPKLPPQLDAYPRRRKGNTHSKETRKRDGIKTTQKETLADVQSISLVDKLATRSGTLPVDFRGKRRRRRRRRRRRWNRVFFFSFFLFLFSIEIVDGNFTEPQESDNWRRSARRRYGTATPKAAASPRPAASRRRAPRPTSTPEPARRSPRPSDNRPSSTAECATSPIAR